MLLKNTFTLKNIFSFFLSWTLLYIIGSLAILPLFWCINNALDVLKVTTEAIITMTTWWEGVYLWRWPPCDSSSNGVTFRNIVPQLDAHSQGQITESVFECRPHLLAMATETWHSSQHTGFRGSWDVSRKMKHQYASYVTVHLKVELRTERLYLLSRLY